METRKLIGKLQENHIKFNATVKDYAENGEEDFETWLIYEVKKYFKGEGKNGINKRQY